MNRPWYPQAEVFHRDKGWKQPGASKYSLSTLHVKPKGEDSSSKCDRSEENNASSLLFTILSANEGKWDYKVQQFVLKMHVHHWLNSSL